MIKEELEGFDIKSVPLKPLEDELKKITGIQVKLDIAKEEDLNRGYFSLKTSKNLVNDSGIFKAAFKEVSIGTFNAQYSAKGESEPYYWMTIDISYKHKGGGSNGARILTAWYHPKANKWDFKLEQ